MPAIRGIQRDFGRFDPKFLGVTLVAGSQRAVDLLLGGPEARSQIRPESLLAEPQPTAFETIALLSASVHEHRHFHDFLIAPSGSLAMRRRLSALVNASQVLRQMQVDDIRDGATCVPVPLWKWCRKPAEERRRLIAGWRLGDDDRVLRLPILDDTEAPIESAMRAIDRQTFAEQIVITIRQYENYRRTFDSPSPRLRPAHVSEASALLVQEQAVVSAFGSECLQLFHDVVRSASDTPYGQAIELVEALLTAAATPGADRASEVVMWSLLGNPMRDGDSSQPVQRSAALGSHVLRHGLPSGERSSHELFAEWDAVLDYPPTIDGVAASLDDSDNLREQLHRARAQVDDDYAGDTLERASAIATMWQAARTEAIERFVSDPDEYVHPKTYIAAIDKYPIPPVIIKTDGGALGVDGDRLEREGFKMVLGYEDSEGRLRALVIAGPEIEHQRTSIDRELALRLLAEFAVADVLFAPHAPDQVDFSICRDEFRESGYLVRQVVI